MIELSDQEKEDVREVLEDIQDGLDDMSSLGLYQDVKMLHSKAKRILRKGDESEK